MLLLRLKHKEELLAIPSNQLPVIVHLIYRLDIGGLERVMLNCINKLAGEPYKHVIISLTDANHFAQDQESPLEVFCLNKKQGNDFSVHFKLFKLLKQIQPHILHSYNLSTIEYHPIAWLAGVPGHIHAEHGRDIADPQGLNKKHNFLRKLMAYFIQRYICVSEDLFQWLISTVGIPQNKALLIQNGIDTEQFNLAKKDSDSIRLAIVARISPVKDHYNLLKALVILQGKVGLQDMPQVSVVGDGTQKAELEKFCQSNKLTSVNFLGARDDIAQIISETDIFVLSSLAEGIPMTILEAMSGKTAVVSTAVGGIPEVITDGVEGFLVEKSNPEALASAIKKYLDEPELIAKHGEKGRERILNHFNEKNMVQAYLNEYNALIGKG
ncbi:TIGR03088 family PEP-CTERM/XrtA system glycosyltransferase [Litorilituus lipolyticus]|uniref:TIGR03088 family PEP-CTERM/XrtA system glycosyltransferase n=1 Tax=Litorilituus lipolyticus TaxID=2491017 RepID=A0A502KP97_9GAMM|nr:TIGR03088 family PEP-CTERM/XrtA system glycosyltransferase [Litorilituus lipolyticus]